VLPTLLANGVLYAEAAPQGSVVAGQSALFRLRGRTREEAAVLPQAALYLYPPSLRPSTALPPDKQEKARKNALEAWAKLYEFLEKAERWCRGDSSEQDLRYASLCPYLAGQRPVVIEAIWAEDIEAALSLARRFGFRVGILDAKEADKVAAQIKAAGAVVIVQRTHALPPTEDSPWDASFTFPRRLLEKGIPVILAHESFWNQRNLPYQAGTAAAYGLSPEEALRLVTEAPAQWLGLSRVGRLAPGYKASLVLAEGDLLDPATSRIRYAWIEGRKVDLATNPQEILYQRYK
jgi:imidazolonepropionase-like amidohydrolase